MPNFENPEVSAPHGEKMIEIRLRFWTNNIASGEGKIIKKHAWSSGVVMMESNKAHGIQPKSPKPFHTLLGITSVIEKVLLEHGIKLHMDKKTKKYLQG